MIRETIHSLVQTLSPLDSLEEKTITETLQWIDSGAPLFRVQKPDVPNKHLVSYFVVFDDVAQKILLVDHKKAQLWLPTGGHVDPDEHPKTTVQRECLEELNVELPFWKENPIFITATVTVGMTAGHTDVSLWYVLKGDSTQSYNYDEGEFNGIQWFDLDKIPYEKSDPQMERFVEKLLTLLQMSF